MSDEKERLVAAFELQLASAIAADNNDAIKRVGTRLFALGALDETIGHVDSFTRRLLVPLRSSRREAAIASLLHVAFEAECEANRDLIVRVCADCLLEVGGPELLRQKAQSVVGDRRDRFVVVEREIGHLFVWEGQ